MIDKNKIKEYLKDLPSKWRDKLTDLLYDIGNDKECPSCEEIKECETLTSLSNFTISGTSVSVQYKDENGVTVTRSFDLSTVLSNYLDLDASCLTDETTWNNLSLGERIQLLIDSHCDCCGEPTTTTTTTSTSTTSTSSTSTTSTSTTTSSSTTTTTTAAPELVYYGAKALGAAPDEAEILLGISSAQDGSTDVTVDWTSFNGTPQYLWWAIPDLSPSHDKNAWYATVINNGNMGNPGDLFESITTVNVGGQDYFVGITAYQTQFVTTCDIIKI